MSTIWATITERHNHITEKLLDSNLGQKDRIALQKELASLTTILEKKRILDDLQKEIVSLQEEVTQSEGEMKELFEEEVRALIQQEAQAHIDLDIVMFPPNEHDNRSVYLEIRAGAGGKEAALFVADLFKNVLWICSVSRMAYKCRKF